MVFINTYLAHFNLHKHLLSIDEHIDDHKKFKLYLRKEYPVNTKKTRYNQNNKLFPTKKYLLIMEHKINEEYIDNLSKYMHLLAVNEIFEEIKKVKAFINSLRQSGRYEENKKNSITRVFLAFNLSNENIICKCFMVIIATTYIYI